MIPDHGCRTRQDGGHRAFRTAAIPVNLLNLGSSLEQSFATLSMKASVYR